MLTNDFCCDECKKNLAQLSQFPTMRRKTLFLVVGGFFNDPKTDL
jgi:hypothetical protein